MRSLLPLTVYCISLVSLQQLLALPAQERPDRNRLDALAEFINPAEDQTSVSGSQTPIVVPVSGPSQSPKWLPGLLRHQPVSGVRAALKSLAWARPTEDSQVERRAPRARRHAHAGSRGHPHHAQLMRVGCVLGTCQVQNLSHRLYQLIGQSGRQDSSPINPRSPHSYG